MLADKTVYDLYSGTGTIAQMLARLQKGYGDHRGSGRGGQKRMRHSIIWTTVNFWRVTSLKVLDTIEERPDYIVLDPPRMVFIRRRWKRLSIMVWII